MTVFLFTLFINYLDINMFFNSFIEHYIFSNSENSDDSSKDEDGVSSSRQDDSEFKEKNENNELKNSNSDTNDKQNSLNSDENDSDNGTEYPSNPNNESNNSDINKATALNQSSQSTNNVNEKDENISQNDQDNENNVSSSNYDIDIEGKKSNFGFNFDLDIDYTIQANKLDQAFTKADFELALENNPAFSKQAQVVNDPLPGQYDIINRHQAIEISRCVGCDEVVNAYDRAISNGRMPVLTKHEDCGHISIGPGSCHNCSIIENNLQKLPIYHHSIIKPKRFVYLTLK